MMRMILISTILVLLATGLTASSAIGADAPLTVSAGGPYSMDEGSTVSMTADNRDPQIVGYYWDIGDDGSVDMTGLSVTFGVGLFALVDGPSNVPVRLNVKDIHANVLATDTTTIQVNNVPPSCGPITAPVVPVAVGTPVAASAPFTDPGVADTHTGFFDWGDGASSAASVLEAAGSGTASATHTYTSPGVYTVALTVTDDDGGAGQCAYQFVVVYDATAGFVAGGGWIDSPPGAYAADPTLTGHATFGFTSRYQRGSNVPTGNTEFHFNAGGLSFKSSSYDLGSLVVAGPRALYSGSGTINGAGNYGFRVTAIDGDVAGGGGIDRFRIKIWDNAGGGVVYDNQRGAADNADPSTAIGGGNIAIRRS